MTSTPSLTPTPTFGNLPSTTAGDVPPQPTGGDPLEDEANLDPVIVGDIEVDVITDNFGNSFLRIGSVDGGVAQLSVETDAVVTGGVSYNVSLYIRSTTEASGCNVTISVGTTFVANSGNDVPTTWTLLAGTYLATGGEGALDVTLTIQCPVSLALPPPPPVMFGKRQNAVEPGLDLDALQVEVAAEEPPVYSVPSISSTPTLYIPSETPSSTPSVPIYIPSSTPTIIIPSATPSVPGVYPPGCTPTPGYVPSGSACFPTSTPTPPIYIPSPTPTPGYPGGLPVGEFPPGFWTPYEEGDGDGDYDFANAAEVLAWFEEISDFLDADGDDPDPFGPDKK